MKEILVIADGMADEPGVDLGAVTPGIDRMRREGTVRRIVTVPEGMVPSSDVAILSLLGYGGDALTGGRGWLEAAGSGLTVDPRLHYARCTVAAGGDGMTARTLSELMPGVVFHPIAPGKFVAVSHYPLEERVAATAGGAEIRIWSAGQARALTPRTGALVCAVPLVRGIGLMAGMEVITPGGATGDCLTDMGAKARAALEAAGRHDFVAIHVEAPDEASHMLRPDLKARMIERIDAEIIAPLMHHGGFRLAVTSDHITSSRSGIHMPGAVECISAEV